MLDTKVQSEEFKFYYFFFLALTFLFAMLMPFSYGDLGIWIAEGRQIMQQGTIYIKDVYSFNPTTESMPYPWLSSLFYYFIDQNFAIESIFFLHRLIPVGIVAFWLCQYPALMHKKSLLTLMICISGIRMLIIDRPALLVLPLVPYFYELFESEKIDRKKVQSLLILILWTNLHGSFMLFFLLFGFKLFTDAIKNKTIFVSKEKVLFLVSAFFATCINPWGIKIYSYVFQTATISKIRITEWQPIALFEEGRLSSDFLIFSVTLALLISMVFHKKKLAALFSSVLPVFLISSILAIRNLPLLFSVFPLFWGKHLVNSTDIIGFAKKAGLMKVVFHRAIIFFFVLSGLFMFTDASQDVRTLISSKYAKKYDETSSFRIAEYLNQSSGKRIFNSWILGSFLIYSQGNQIFIDTRNIIYGNDLYDDYLKISNNNFGMAEAMLDQYRIDFVVTEKIYALSDVLANSETWTLITEDNGYFLFERK